MYVDRQNEMINYLELFVFYWLSEKWSGLPQVQPYSRLSDFPQCTVLIQRSCKSLSLCILEALFQVNAY